MAMKITIAAALLLLVSGATYAQPPESSEAKFSERFRRADTNGDGVIDGAEARAAGLWFADDLNSVDTDHSGTVTLLELGQALQQRIKGWMSDFDAADTNHDGKLSEAEARNAPRVAQAVKGGTANQAQGMSRPEYESYAIDRLYRNSELPAVAPNIIEKKF
jgi:hypothetical protein